MGYCPSSVVSTTQDKGTSNRPANSRRQPSGSKAFVSGSLAGELENGALFLTGVEGVLGAFFLLGAIEILGGPLVGVVGTLRWPESPSEIQKFKCKLPFRRFGSGFPELSLESSSLEGS